MRHIMRQNQTSGLNAMDVPDCPCCAEYCFQRWASLKNGRESVERPEWGNVGEIHDVGEIEGCCSQNGGYCPKMGRKMGDFNRDFNHASKNRSQNAD